MTAPEPIILQPVRLDLVTTWEDDGLDFSPVYTPVEPVIVAVTTPVGVEQAPLKEADASPKEGFVTEPALTLAPGTTLMTVDLPPTQSESNEPPPPSVSPAPVALDQSSLIMVEDESLEMETVVLEPA